VDRYNKVDGTFCSAHSQLYKDVLRGDWGYRGMTMSDWFAVHDTVEPIKAGLDLEMPFPVYRSGHLVASVQSGEVSEAEVDACVLKMLELRDRTKACHGNHSERSEVTAEASELAREIARSGMVLLKNKQATLPIANAASVALIGEFARDPVFTGGGSASCIPQYRHSPLEVLRDEFRHVEYALGMRTRRIIPVAPKEKLRAQHGLPGVDISFYNHGIDDPILTERGEDAKIWMLGEFRAGLKVPGSHVRLSTSLTPSTTGIHTLAVRCTGAFTLSINGVQVAAGPAVSISTEQFIFNHILLETRTEVSMVGRTSYNIELIMQGPSKLTIGEPTPYAATLAFEEAYSEDEAIEEAVRIAQSADVSIIYAGRNDQYESEGFDLDTIELPTNQARLIQAVSAASKKTVVVLHCGNPIDVSVVIEHVDAILLAHFPGQEGARAVADLLTGRACPSGKLATTWFKTLDDAPSFAHFPPRKLEDGTVEVRYAEGVGVGYRAPRLEDRVQWPFGFGLSYTTFETSGLEVAVDEGAKPAVLRCSVRVKNTGTVAGREVVQLYVTPPPAASIGGVWRPGRELKAFVKTPKLITGEEQQVDLVVELDMACSHWEEERRAWRLAPGVYGVMIANQRGEFIVVQERFWNHL
jgi:beta-glucosidase